MMPLILSQDNEAELSIKAGDSEVCSTWCYGSWRSFSELRGDEDATSGRWHDMVIIGYHFHI